MTISMLAFTEAGFALGERLAEHLPDAAITRCPNGGLAPWTAAHFGTDTALVYIGSAGIAVRAIAPHALSKATDPAVVVIDEHGRFAIPILSGHIGQANRLARRIAAALGATPVITTATDGRGLFAVDEWATRQGLRIANPDRIQACSAALLAARPLHLATEFPIAGPLPEGVILGGDTWDAIVTCRALEADEPALHLVPPVLSAGIGCRRSIGAAAVEDAFTAALSAAGCDRLAVAEVCTIDLKADEPGLREFCRLHQLPLRAFSAAELAAAAGQFHSSDFVSATVGVDNVCERAAVLGQGGYLVASKLAHNGVTVALALREPRLRFADPCSDDPSSGDPFFGQSSAVDSPHRT
jgi:cobalt-precorrin 5A hydrolase